MYYKGLERRGCSRSECDTAVEFGLKGEIPARTHIGAAVDISASGICMYTFDPFKEEDAIEILGDTTVPHRTATVRWAKECYKNFYRIGVAFNI